MKGRGQKLILISFILALIAAVAAFAYLQSLKSSSEAAKKTTILVAAETISPGTLIDKKMIKKIQVPYNPIFDNYIKDSSKIAGKYTTETISKNEGFHIDKLLEKGGDELNLKIDNDYRAISISVTGDSGVSGLLKPKDYVDIIVYTSEKRDGIKVVRPDEAKIVLQNIQVLAVDKQISRDNKESNSNKSSDNGKAPTNFLVTLSVKVSDLEKVVLAQSIGSIKLALRPLKDEITTQTNGTTWEDMSVNTDEKTFNKENNLNITSSENYKSYTVEPGDTLKSISRKVYENEDKYTAIKEANNIQDENLILTGETIKIPILGQ
ncbi:MULTISPECIES: Flp pilus assembly protein CpaB [Clostridium]|uniref:LysM domain/BON superfamily protein n=2 Tax=Clostridium TaxID=1485 RepID=D8GP53_CLOLD|nr:MULTISPECIES: Flp pilus assembly protein CpaB [Clostridium]ADK15931.1 putative cell wall binding protein [Clostridium ljungdahlii DSM 13528]AGY75106.1 Flp pilus assembly protein CpaB [Clostridium autoethanogenum DSM 10061]ALU35277.1 Flp pilus assembly protein CpaB [Clostridium autoethanogenum DSM 10061]OAA87191.1 LysM domain/BON superfamily protein [Clostridium ljungdahlii DSM 13528]OVY49644.1 LysM domain/BON superfamily protein [Clostridium autoethanogenum]